ncbi:T9SS type A sorting domain-containing protein [Adhaeribacter soli]|uniref:T9SS type A sorting domain-containing protein n=1 Tax=Adhaeribacter soli TaxID=2607655 RepID=A0A5N1J1C4_9BACT|nr:T9SS type A sorting domain-containing protein [Adhaeribacter soli]KAA9340548.1 T9SS type A sorting domain-containing protein [Adhaeribacter soli]
MRTQLLQIFIALLFLLLVSRAHGQSCQVQVSASATTIYFGETVSLTATGAASYVWAPSQELSANTGSAITATPTATTTYMVIGTCTDNSTSSETITITVLPPKLPYIQPFDLQALGWTAGGTNSSWALGTPNKPNLTSAASGTKAWVTGGLTGQYHANENSWLQSPRFDFSNLLHPQLEMKVWWDTETNTDGVVMQASVSNGAWQTVGTVNAANNWYNSSNISALPGNQGLGWSGTGTTGSNGWVLAKVAVPTLAGANNVRFRFVFKADAKDQYAGFGLDDFTIKGSPDLAVSSLRSPLQGCVPVSAIAVRLQNKNVETIDLALTPVTVQVAVSGAKTGTFSAVLDTGSIVGNSYYEVKVPSPGFTMNTTGTYTFSISSPLSGDVNPADNSMTKAVAVTGTAPMAPLPQPYFQDFTSSTPTGWAFINTGIGSGWLQMVPQFRYPKQEASSPKIGGLTAKSFLVFDYYYNDMNYGVRNDRILVEMQQDCDTAFIPLMTLDQNHIVPNPSAPTSPDQFTSVLIPLKAFAGSDAKFRLRLLGDPNYQVWLYFDNFGIREINPVDVGLSEVKHYGGGQGNCRTGGEGVSVKLNNYSSEILNLSVNKILLTVKATNPSGTITTVTKLVDKGTLNPNRALDILVSATGIPMLQAGTYLYEATAKLLIAGIDTEARNDTARGTTVVTPAANGFTSVPYFQEFTFLNSNWQSTFNLYNNRALLTGKNSQENYAQALLTNINPDDYLTSETFGNITAGHYLFFDYFFKQTDTVSINPAQSGAYLEVAVSEECGGAFTPLARLEVKDNVLTNGFRKLKFDLAAFAGKNIRIKITVGRTNGNFTVGIDRFEIKGTEPDVAVERLYFPENLCAGWNSSGPIKAWVYNNGFGPIDFSATPATLTLKRNNAQVYTVPVNSGILLPDSSLMVTLAGSHNFNTGGNLEYKGEVTFTGDISAANNTATHYFYTEQAFAVPYFQPFGTASDPFWKPDPVNSGMHIDVPLSYFAIDPYLYGVTAFSSSARNSERIISSPAITGITATTKLAFDLELKENGLPVSLANTAHKLLIEVTTDCGQTFTLLDQIDSSNYVQSQYAKKMIYSLAPFAGSPALKIRFRVIADKHAPAFPYFKIETFEIINQEITDLAMRDVVTPTNGCAGPGRVQITVANMGTAAVSNIPVSYQVVGHSAFSETINRTLNPGDTLQYVFRNLANLNAIQEYQIEATVNHPADLATTNNTIRAANKVIRRAPVTAPYSHNFNGLVLAENVFMIHHGFILPNSFPFQDVKPVNNGIRFMGVGTANFPGNPPRLIWAATGPGGSVTPDDAWNKNANYQNSASICVDATSLTNPELVFDLKQTFCNKAEFSWFRVLVNGVQVSLDYKPTTASSDPFVARYVDLSAFAGTVFTLTFQSSTRDDDYQCSGDAAFIDNMFIRNKVNPAIDAGIMAISYNPATFCTTTNTITADLQNTGSTNFDLSLNPVKLILSVTGKAVLKDTVVINTGMFTTGEVRKVTFPRTLNMHGSGNYTAAVSLQLAGDGVSSNNLRTQTLTITAPRNIPYAENFDNFNSTGWSSSTAFDIRARTLFLDQPNAYQLWKESVVTPKLGAITATSYLIFELSASSYTPASTSADDKLRIQVSTDCGLNFSDVHVFDAAALISYSTVNKAQISLAAFAGQEIRIRFLAEFGTGGNLAKILKIDNLEVKNLNSILSLKQLLSPYANCTANEPISLTFKNEGVIAHNFQTDPAELHVLVKGPNPQAFIQPLTAGMLAPNAQMQVNFSQKVNMNQNGVYTFKSFLKRNNSIFSDTLTTVLKLRQPRPLPFRENFQQMRDDSLLVSWASKGFTVLNTSDKQISGTSAGTGIDSFYVQTPQVALPQNQTFLKFDYRISGGNFGTFTSQYNPNSLSRLEVQVSANCGPFTTIHTLNPANTPPGQAIKTVWLPLNAFAGQNITVRFTGYKDGNPITVTLDNVEIAEVSGKDIAVLDIIEPEASSCSDSIQPVKVIISNKGPVPVTNMPLNLAVNQIPTLTASVTLQPFTTDTIRFTGFSSLAGGTYQISVTAELPDDMQPADNTRAISVKIFRKPEVNLGGDDCLPAGGSKTLTAGKAGMIYLWNTGATTQTLTINTTGTYSVTVWDPASGCSSTDAVTIRVGQTPVVDLGPDRTSCGAPVVLDAGAGYTYLWSNGATTQTIAVSYSDTLFAKVTNPVSGCTSSDTVVVTFNPVPVVNLGNDKQICSGDQVILNAYDQPGFTYAWETLGGAFLSSDSALTVNSPGTYVVVKTSALGCIASDTVTITVNPLPLAALGTDTAFCTGGNVMLNAPAGTGYSYRWFRNGTVLAGITAASHPVNTPGTYTVEITNTNGCSQTSPAIQVTEIALPVPVISSASALTFCSGDSILLQTPALSGNQYQWLLNGSSIAGANGPDLKVKTSGLYAVTETNASGCSATSVAVQVQTIARQVPVVSASGTTSFCRGGNVTLFTTTPGSYQWYRNSTSLAGANQASLAVGQSGNYQLFVTNASGCTDTAATVAVTVNAAPAASISASGNLTFCAGDSVVLRGFSGSTNTYQWYHNGNLITGASADSLVVKQSGNYAIKVTNADGCDSTAAAVTVTVNPKPIATIVQTGNMLVASAGTSYQWYHNGNLIPGATNQVLQADSTGSYTVQITQNGCTATSAAVNIIISGTTETLTLEHLHIFPNPATVAFQVKLSNKYRGPVQFQLFDLTGRLIQKQELLKNEAQLETSLRVETLPTGLYMLRVQQGEKQVVKKLTIKR